MIALKIASMPSVLGSSLLLPSVAVPVVGTVMKETLPASMPSIDSARSSSDSVFTPST